MITRSSHYGNCPKLHRRFNVDFNGWWLCLIPTACMKQIGLSMPAFIKFDDIEYGLRAKEHGFHTVSLPGVAVWHQAWHDKGSGPHMGGVFQQPQPLGVCIAAARRKAQARSWRTRWPTATRTWGLRFIYSESSCGTLHSVTSCGAPSTCSTPVHTQLNTVRELRKGFSDTDLKPNLTDFPEAKAEFEPHAVPKSKAAVAEGMLQGRAQITHLTNRRHP